jgi:hypothetical protein
LNAEVPGLMPVFESLDALANASMPPCLIVNPLSFRASRGLAEQAQAVAKAQGAEVVVVDGPASLTAAVDAILVRRQRHVMVLAGDGTVRAVIDQLASLPRGSWMPDLLVLPGGRTNLTAADLVPGRGCAHVAETRPRRGLRQALGRGHRRARHAVHRTVAGTGALRPVGRRSADRQRDPPHARPPHRW